MSEKTGDKKKGMGLGKSIALGALMMGTGLVGVAVTGAYVYSQTKK